MPLAHPQHALKCPLAEARESINRRFLQIRCGYILISILPCLQHRQMPGDCASETKLLKVLQHSEMHFKLRFWLRGGQRGTQGFSLGFKLESICLASTGVQGSAWAGQTISLTCITHSSAMVFLGTSCTSV